MMRTTHPTSTNQYKSQVQCQHKHQSLAAVAHWEEMVLPHDMSHPLRAAHQRLGRVHDNHRGRLAAVEEEAA